jgi:hypothetical protein
MPLDTAVGLCLAVAFAAAACFDYKEEKHMSQAVSEPYPAKRSLVSRGLIFATIGVIAGISIAMAAYLFVHVPVRLLEMAAGLVIASLTVRLLSRLAGAFARVQRHG